MKLTNTHNLPQTIINALSHNYKPKEGRLSVTDLVNPPLIRKLRMKHWDDIEEDASEKLWMLLGTSMHYILEQHSPEDAFQEEKLTCTVKTNDGEITIVGKSDLWHNRVISDWKTTSVYSFLLGSKPEWEAQMNLYKWLWEQNGFDSDKLVINAILRDWSKTKSVREDDYPKIPFWSVDIPIWTQEEIYSYIMERVTLHQSSKLTECTPEEKWQRPCKFALMKKGRKSAVKLFDSDLEAELELDFIEKDKDIYYIEKREGQNIRCENYCNVSKFCPYYKGGDKNE